MSDLIFQNRTRDDHGHKESVIDVLLKPEEIMIGRIWRLGRTKELLFSHHGNHVYSFNEMIEIVAKMKDIESKNELNG